MDDPGVFTRIWTGVVTYLAGKSEWPEVICAEIGRTLGLPVPEVVLVELDAAIGQNEPDEEIQDLLRKSVGLNFGIDYLPGALGFDGAAARAFDPVLAARVIWFDAFVTNIDRTAKNPNILMWHREPWLIDHGAALYFQYDWDGSVAKSANPFPQVRDHVLLQAASSIADVDGAARASLKDDLLGGILAMVPQDWLEADGPTMAADASRAAYVAYLGTRRDASQNFVEEAEGARTGRV